MERNKIMKKKLCASEKRELTGRISKQLILFRNWAFSTAMCARRERGAKQQQSQTKNSQFDLIYSSYQSFSLYFQFLYNFTV